jgi:hypothetical protein
MSLSGDLLLTVCVYCRMNTYFWKFQISLLFPILRNLLTNCLAPVNYDPSQQPGFTKLA